MPLLAFFIANANDNNAFSFEAYLQIKHTSIQDLSLGFFRYLWYLTSFKQA